MNSSRTCLKWFEIVPRFTEAVSCEQVRSLLHEIAHHLKYRAIESDDVHHAGIEGIGGSSVWIFVSSLFGEGSLQPVQCISRLVSEAGLGCSYGQSDRKSVV